MTLRQAVDGSVERQRVSGQGESVLVQVVTDDVREGTYYITVLKRRT